MRTRAPVDHAGAIRHAARRRKPDSRSHVDRTRHAHRTAPGGGPGFVAAWVAFIAPAAVLVGLLASLYVTARDLPVLRGVLTAVQPVVLVIVLERVDPAGPDGHQVNVDARDRPGHRRDGACRCA